MFLNIQSQNATDERNKFMTPSFLPNNQGLL